MAYQKILVDNLTCRRRFHLSFDDSASPQEEATARCQHCDAVIFSQHNHPPVSLVRDETLTKTTRLSPLRTRACNFTDTQKK